MLSQGISFLQVRLSESQQQPAQGAAQRVDANGILGWDMKPATDQKSKISAHQTESEQNHCRLRYIY